MATFHFSSSPSVLLQNCSTFASSPPISAFSLHSPNNSSTLVKKHESIRSSTFVQELDLSKSCKWRTGVSFFPSFFTYKTKDAEALKQELFEAIAPLDRGADATPEDQERIDEIARQLEAINKVKEPLKSDLLNGKWELLYTTSGTILQTQRPKFLRPNGKIYQAINIDTLRAQNLETWPFFNQATANLVPVNGRRVTVKFDSFKIASLIPIKSRGSGRGQIEITYLDKELRITRGNQGNLFILRLVDPDYQIPL